MPDPYRIRVRCRGLYPPRGHIAIDFRLFSTSFGPVRMRWPTCTDLPSSIRQTTPSRTGGHRRLGTPSASPALASGATNVTFKKAPRAKGEAARQPDLRFDTTE